MRSLAKRQRVLGGALLVALAIWAVSSWIGPDKPAAVLAKQSGLVDEKLTATADTLDGPQELDAFIEKVTRSDYRSVAGELDMIGRDVFVPTSLLTSAIYPPREVSLMTLEAEAPAEEAEAQKSFPERHTLVGVMIGGQALAAVDDQVIALGSELDGHVLVEVKRDYVVFVEPQTGERFVLALDQGPKRSGN